MRDPDKTQLNLQLSHELRDYLQETAEQAERSLAGQVRWLIRQDMERQTSPDDIQQDLNTGTWIGKLPT